MAVNPVKGSGIGQVALPTDQQVEQMARENLESRGLGDIFSSYLQGAISGTGDRVLLPAVPEFAPEPQTRLGQLFDIPGILESGAEGARLAAAVPAATAFGLTEGLGNLLMSPTKAGVQEEIDRIEAELSPFREEARRRPQTPQTTLGSFTTASGETRPKEGFATPIEDQAEQEKDPLEQFGGTTGDAKTEQIISDKKAEAENEFRNLTTNAVQDYLDLAKAGVKPKSYSEYIKEFSEATGLDVSGKPDKSTALMALGLSLMQNKAGKEFNVSNILTAVGEAGKEALPAFEKAKSEARAIRAKAGEFSISRKREDEAIARQRGGYFIVPKSQGMAGRIKAFTEESRRANLNAFELDALFDNESFRNNFDIIPASEYNDVLKELTKKPEYGEMYASSYTNIPLFKDAGEDLSIEVQRVNANYKGPNMPSRGYFNADEYDDYAQLLNSMRKGLDKTGAKLAEAYSIVNSGETTTMDQIGDAAISLGRALGIKIGEGATPTARVIRILNVIAAERAPEILGEAGKTISDNDRQRVREIVGELQKFSDPETLKLALNEMYDTIVTGGYNDINEGFTKLNRYSGRSPQERPTKLTKRTGTESTFDATV